MMKKYEEGIKNARNALENEYGNEGYRLVQIDRIEKIYEDGRVIVK